MFVLCVLHSKDKKALPGQRGSTDELQRTKTKIPSAAWMFLFFVCCTVRTKGKFRTIRTKEYR